MVVKVQDVLSTIKLAPWYRELCWVVEYIPAYRADFVVDDMPNCRFRIEYFEPDTNAKHVRGQCEYEKTPGCPACEVQRQCGRWWYVSPDMNVEAVIKTAWLALVVSDEHRRRESFRVGNALLFNPHAPLRWPTLWDMENEHA